MFRFGKNWKEYVSQKLDENKLHQARTDLAQLLQCDDLSGQTFLDIGCGSGLHSVSAVRLGARAVYAFDYDMDSVEVTQQVAARFLTEPERQKLHIRQASILDRKTLDGLPACNIVYSWGVLHHTGAMYDAIKNASSFVKNDGLFVIAIYNRHATSTIWHAIKYTYNRSPEWGQRGMYYLFYVVIFIAKFLSTRKNPLKKERGMDFGYDVIDWIGGYPYEYATADEISSCVKGLGYEVIRIIPASTGTGCNEFVFRHKVNHQS